MKKNKKNPKYLARSSLLPGLLRFDPEVPLRKRRSEDFSVTTDGYFHWDECEKEGHNNSLQARRP